MMEMRVRFNDDSEQLLVSKQTQGIWYWFPPDHMQLDTEYHTVMNGVIYPRECTFTLGGCPAVFPLGEADGHKNIRAVPFDERWQLFTADLFALSKYGKLYGQLNWSERDFIRSKFTGTFGYKVAFTNGKGFGMEDDPRANFVKRENLKAPVPEFHQSIICGTNSAQGQVIVNAKGEEMLRVKSFIYEDDPPVGYGMEILNDARVMVATIQYPEGIVGAFPRLGATVYYPFVTLRAYPAHYPLRYVWSYTGERAPVYWNEKIK